ncbi:carboxypeptidase-like regulatory domain-containing protein [Flavobacterium cerinum]|uniref:Carboxypeptidase-like regulatory domain-containing protein n=1 Tax=Flavobacterium cerinum TaxID=2502784 RepID=A0ABY5IRU3_9FLAO|nr:carboxypeptidase-like regulatory domain-containing protein [Flavobacterium cerinum]UUC45585.1 carboxypeptidase-like regulatory domain-containing protein [Flavobacterium cerinum]
MIISGIVFLKDDGKSVYGGTVTVKETGQTATTNIDGTFSINVPDFNSVLSFDFYGLTLPVEKTAAEVTGQTTWLQLDPSDPGAQIKIRPDYKPVYWMIGIAAVTGIAALVLLATGNNSEPQKKEVKPKEVEV